MTARMRFAECTWSTVGFLAMAAGASVVLPGAVVAQNGGGPRAEVIYGDDNRLDLFDRKVPESWRELAKSTAILVKKVDLSTDPSRDNHMSLKADSFGNSMNLCPDERFREQPTPGFCSGFLVGPDILVTAGHCMDGESRCRETAFVFDYGYLDPLADLGSVPQGNVYGCKEVIAQSLDRVTSNDYAVIRLDRQVDGRTPLKFRKEGQIERGTNLLVIGHPSGLPTKVAAGASVRSTETSKPFFVANLDTYGGNSGSAVFNEGTGEVEGILVRGETDFQYVNGCAKSYVCGNSACRGEDVTRATEFASALDDATRPSETGETSVDGIDSPIPDNDPANPVVQALSYEKSGIIAEVGVTVQVDHSYPADLVVSLRHPDGTEIILGKMGGFANGPKYDGRPLEVAERKFGMGGIAVPELKKLKGKPSAGSWEVLIHDRAKSDTGNLTAVTLKVRTYVP
jgi:subtilisin-like proprotein convertase family protein